MRRRAEGSTIKRLLIIACVFGVICFAAIAVRLFKLQVVDHDKYQFLALEQQTREKTIYAARGTIYDRNLKPLAISAATEMVTIEAVKIKTDEQGLLIARTMSELLELDYDNVLAIVQKKATYVVLKRGVEKDVADQVRAFVRENKLNSIYLAPDSTRKYPFGNFLSHVLGFVGADEQGLYGLEYQYDSVLTGVNGKIITATNAKGEEMPFQNETFYDATDGYSLILTIDEVLQHYLEKNLDIAVYDNNVQNKATAIVMDVNTGGILAMATKPDFDPNAPFTITDQKLAEQIAAILDPDAQKAARSAALQDQWLNKAINYTYYPGSTFKIVTASTALEENKVTLESKFNCNGIFTVGSHDIRCWRYPRAHGTQTLAEAIQNSCNPAFIQIGQAIGVDTFNKYIKAFGITEKTGIDLPGEASGIYFDMQSMRVIDLAVASFGQNFSVTPLQLITAVSAVANGGTLYQPYVVQEIIDASGNTIQRIEPKAVRQVISKETSDTMRTLLENVVTYGTGANAYTIGYRVAGKTGTTENIAKNNANPGEKFYISSFVAFAPADDPKIAVLIILDEPNVYPFTGGITCAPVIRRFMEEAMLYLNVAPIYTDKELANRDVVMPNITGMTRTEAEAAMKNAGVQYRLSGSGDIVTDQMPAFGARITSRAEAVVYMGGERPQQEVRVPDLAGMSPEEALQTLKEVGLYMRTSGILTTEEDVIVTRQDIEKDTLVSPGTVIVVDLSDMGQLSQ